MTASVNARAVPGSTSSSLGAEAVGYVTATVGTAASWVARFSAASAPRRSCSPA